jgi:hypothetical protein
MLAYIIWESDFLQFFADNRDFDNWEDTALNWVVAALVVSVLCAGLTLIYKWFRKKSAGVIKEQAWSRGETIVLMLAGLLPVFLLTLAVWFASRDFGNVIGVGGLMKGVAFSWVLYLLLMFIGHLASPWRRELL